MDRWAIPILWFASFAAAGELNGSQEESAASAPTAHSTVVTGTRLPRPLPNVTGTVVVLPREEIERDPSLGTDELVRTVPSVGTFRRSTTSVSDPSAQGLSLRGIGPSGVSRGLVLLDGIPINDAFGGWVYWQALPRLGLEKVEVAPIGASALYGNFALGGVVQLFSRAIESAQLDARLLGGSYGTAQVAARGAKRNAATGASLEGEFVRTDGYPVVAPNQRGPIDHRANSNHFNVAQKFEWTDKLQAQVDYFQEAQNGGTEFTTADVRVLRYALRGRTDGRIGEIEALFYGHVSRFDQGRGRASLNRASEALASQQEVPSNDQAIALNWTQQLIPSHHLLAGLELRRVSGKARERLYPIAPSAPPDQRESGGEQRFLGAYIQELAEWSQGIETLAALRFDGWQNRSGYRRAGSGDSFQETAFPSRLEGQVNPLVGASFRPSSWLTLRGSGYRAFRAPTLNELYRPFQVGSTITAANENLRSETLWGAEAGVEIALGHAAGSVTGFWNELERAVSNVTLDNPLPDGARRQRQNVGRARIRGTEISLLWRAARWLSIVGAYTFVDASVVENNTNPSLVGKQIPQDPRHRATFDVTLNRPPFSLLLRTRWIGPQYEDDLNLLPMGGVVLFDASASWQLVREFQLFLTAENLLDRTYLVGRSGPDTIGQPRMVLGGLRLTY